MDVVFTRCAGLDVHKKSITACRIVPDPTGQEAEGLAELRTFGTMTRELLALADWLAEASITHVAMESTGEYWKPVYNLLEGTLTVFLVNAAHVKLTPCGRPRALTRRTPWSRRCIRDTPAWACRRYILRGIWLHRSPHQ